MSEIKIDLTTENKEVIVRTGEAAVIKEPKINILSGVLDSPAKWLEKRVTEIAQKQCFVLVDRNSMSIKLVTDEDNFYRKEVSGKLEYHPKFLLFGINSSKYVTAFEMAELIKMNRSFFDNHTTAMDLVSALKNFKASVNKEIEKADNNRGNKKILVDQVVQSNMPETFKLILPIFKGQNKEEITVEVYFNADDLTCTLVSPEANDKLENTRDTAIDAVLSDIKELAPDIAIIEM